jgi:DNA-binding MarR family transcriptional regulator
MNKIPSTSPTFCSNSVMRKATRRLGQLFDDVLEPSGLKATQHGLLAHIHALNAPTIKELAEDLVMDLSALGHTLKPLERDGLVVLVRDERDRRAKRVTLTPAGASKFEETTKLWRLAQVRFETAFGQRKAEKLRKALSLLASEDFNEAFLTATKVKRSRSPDIDRQMARREP